jgi:hypothetical protein
MLVDYGMVSKIEKAKRYAEQRDRIRFVSFEVTFDGDNNPHTVTYRNGAWECDCSFFSSRKVCSHSMAMERVLDGMLAQTASAES